MFYIAYLSIAVFGASFVATLAGFGISTILIPIMAIFLPLPIVLFLVAIIHFIINFWKFLLARRFVNWRLVLYFGLVGGITSFIGGLLVAYRPMFIIRALGAFLIIYVFFLFFNPTFRVKVSHFVAVIGGAINGFMAGIIGMRGALQTLLLSAFNLPARIHIATLSAIALIVDSSRLIAYCIGGVRLSLHLFYILLFVIPISFLGVRLAYYFVDKISQHAFRILVAIFLFLIGLKFLIFAA